MVVTFLSLHHLLPLALKDGSTLAVLLFFLSQRRQRHTDRKEQGKGRDTSLSGSGSSSLVASTTGQAASKPDADWFLAFSRCISLLVVGEKAGKGDWTFVESREKRKRVDSFPAFMSQKERERRKKAVSRFIAASSRPDRRKADGKLHTKCLEIRERERRQTRRQSKGIKKETTETWDKKRKRRGGWAFPSSLLPPSSMIPVFGSHSKMLILYPSTLFLYLSLFLPIHEFIHKDRQNTTPTTSPMGLFFFEIYLPLSSTTTERARTINQRG